MKAVLEIAVIGIGIALVWLGIAGLIMGCLMLAGVLAP